MFKNIRKILIITGVRIGDQLMNTPLFRAVRHRFPCAKITLATGYPAINLLEDNVNIDELLTIDKNIIKKVLEKGTFDLAIDLCGEQDVAYLIAISGARYRVSFGPINRKSSLFTLLPRVYSRREISFIDVVLRLAKKIGIRPHGRETELVLKHNEINEAKKLLRNKGVKEKDFVVGIFVSGSRPHILWSPRNFGLFADKIACMYGAKILFLYGKNELADLRKAILVMKYDYVLSGVHSIRMIAALVSLCKCIVASDGGTMHIAAALKIPTIAFFGPYSEKIFFPYSLRNNIVVTKDIKCRPCDKGYKVCKHKKCIKTLTVDEAWNNAEPFLHKLIKQERLKRHYI